MPGLTKFEYDQICWAKFGQIWWPSMICNEEHGSNCFIKSKGKITQYFVYFFGPKYEYAWIPEQSLFDFKSNQKENFLKNKKLPTGKNLTVWNEAVEDATCFENESNDEKELYFYKKYKQHHTKKQYKKSIAKFTKTKVNFGNFRIMLKKRVNDKIPKTCEEEICDIQKIQEEVIFTKKTKLDDESLLLKYGIKPSCVKLMKLVDIPQKSLNKITNDPIEENVIESPSLENGNELKNLSVIDICDVSMALEDDSESIKEVEIIKPEILSDVSMEIIPEQNSHEMTAINENKDLCNNLPLTPNSSNGSFSTDCSCSPQSTKKLGIMSIKIESVESIVDLVKKDNEPLTNLTQNSFFDSPLKTFDTYNDKFLVKLDRIKKNLRARSLN